MREQVEGILRGNIRAASRLMRDIDEEAPSAMPLLRSLYPHTGKAYIIGITGPPGSGKSTLVDKMIAVFRDKGKSVGVVAIDPTSPFSGGAILGDRIRMQRHATDEHVFIRSLGTRGSLGGLSRSTRGIIQVMDAMGKDVILVETVGVGQDEVKIIDIAHISIVVLTPGMGDDIQAIKAGILEIADLFVINKSDFEGAGKLEQYLRDVLAMGSKKGGSWKPPLVKTVAVSGDGVEELIERIDQYRKAMEGSPNLENRLRERAKATFLEILETEVMRGLLAQMDRENIWESILDELVTRRADPYSIAESLIAKWPESVHANLKGGSGRSVKDVSK